MRNRSLRHRTTPIVLAWVAAALVAADDPKKPPATPAEAHQREEAEVAQALRESWPDHPEWVDMLTAILEDEPMGPDFGWFRTAKTQTRFGWEATRKRLDRDHDGRIGREEFAGSDAEFAGSDAEFARLDRDRDGVLTAPDFDFSASALDPSPGTLLFARLDRNDNGKVTREELDAFFRASDRDGRGFLSLSDLQEAFAPPPQAARAAGAKGPSKATLIRGLFHQELGSLEPGPKLGEPAPDFTLASHDHQRTVRLSQHRGAKPVVLIFGSFT